MSSYEKMPRSRKIVGQQHGLKRLTLRDRGTAGYPKVAEVWLPMGRWTSIDAPDMVSRFKNSIGDLLGIDVQLLDLEV